MKKILIVLFGVLTFQGHVFAESWVDPLEYCRGKVAKLRLQLKGIPQTL